MKNILLLAISLIFAGLISTPLFSQGVAINTSGNPADASAMLDVQSTSGGILIPRMTLAQRGNLASPASGLLIYQTDNQPGFYYYNGTVWTKISTGLDVSGTQNYVSKFTGANSLGNSQIFDNGTNVGIGTSSPTSKLQVAGMGYFSSGATIGVLADATNTRGVFGAGTSHGVYGQSSNIGVYGSGSNYGIYGTGNYGVYGTGFYGLYGQGTNYGVYGQSATWAGYFSGNMYVSGNTGIGVSPTYKLHVAGTGYFVNGSNSAYMVDSGNGRGVSGVGVNQGVYGNSSNYGVFGQGGSYGVYGMGSVGVYGQGTTWASYFDGNTYISGSTGIGTTSPTAQLHTTGTVRFANYINGVLRVDSNGNLGVATGSSIFTAGNGLSWSGNQLNSVWSFSGNNIYNNNSGNVGIGASSPSQKLHVSGGNILNEGILYHNTSLGQGSGAHGISWYQPSFVTWFDYMAPPGTTNAPSGTAAPTDATANVTSWARRFNIENIAGYGWIFESGSNTAGSAPTAKFAISSNTGNFHSTGSGVVDGTLRAGAYAILGTGTSAGYYQDATNGAYRAIVGAGTTNGYYFQTNAGGTTTMYVGLGGTYNGRVGIGTTTPSYSLHVPSGYIGTDYINTTDNVVGSGVTGIMVKAGDNYHRTANASAILSYLGVTAPTGDNLGNHTATTTLNMNNNQITNFSYMQPYGVGGDSGQGNNAYGIFQEGGSWSSPYPDLRIAFHTGIKLGANASYNGIRFYNDYDMSTLVMAINDAGTSGANNVYMAGGLKAGSAFNINIPNSCGGNWATNCDLAIWTGDHTGGCGDEAYIAHYARSGEATTLEIGNKNDADDHIALMPSGNVGIGVTAPADKLEINGNLRFSIANPYITASSYFIVPGGAYFNSGTVYTEAQYQCRGGIHNDAAGDLTIAGGTNGTTYFSGSISGMSSTIPSNYMVRLTPNLHLNAGSGYAVIANWDNGTTGTSQAFRIGNGAGVDAFYVRADSYTWAGTTSTSLANVIYASRPYGNYGANRATIYGYRGGGGNGTGYGYTGTDNAVQGWTWYGDYYAFGVAGHTYGDYYRTGGVIGGDINGSYWGSLGYKNSGGTWYGLYYTSAGSGGGFMSNNGVASGVGMGGYGDVMGGWSRGEVLGFTTAGELYASYNLGNEYTSGVSADIVTTDSERIPVYSVTSNDVKVYADGSAQLINGKCYVSFDESFVGVISKEGKPTITVTPNGECNGLYTVEISSNGFTVKELNNGTSSVEFSWIAIGKRIDAEKAGELPQALKDKNFDNNLKGVMFNENAKDNSATPIWWDGNNLRFDKMPETPVNKPKDDPNMPSGNNGDDVNRLIQQDKQSQPNNGEWRPTRENPVNNSQYDKSLENK